jgi:hypothetical protein
MAMTEEQKATIIKKTVTNLTVEPYNRVKRALDSFSKKTRKALGVSL